MIDALTPPAPPAAATAGASAGALLRAARERRGVHIAVLATAVKVSLRKVEALESDRYDLLPDVTFARALAASLCRALAIDATPVLALLPAAPSSGAGLEQVHNGLNMPLRARSGRVDLSDWRRALRRPALWLPLLLVLAALLVYLMPQALTARRASPEPAAQPAAPGERAAEESSTGRLVMQPPAPAGSPVIEARPR